MLDAIRKQGLQPRKRQHVHLTGSERTAVATGARHGRPAVLRVRAGELHAKGEVFMQASNGVWLCARAPASFIDWGATTWPTET